MRLRLIYFLLVAVLFTPLCARRSGGTSTGSRIGGGGAHYPRSSGYSGNSNPVHSYPHSTGLSGNSGHRSTSYSHKTEVHHHYHYNPPQRINYGSVQHPVYQHSPPIYVYEYRNSGSRFDSLLTGLALYNLGRMSANHDHNYHYDPSREYRTNPGEICMMSVSKSNGEYEETKIDCKLISSFIWEAETQSNKVVTANTVSTTINVTRSSTTTDGNSTNTTTLTVQNTTVVDALKVKGPSLQVSPGMQCFMIRIYRGVSKLKKKIDCGLLQEYARSSMKYYNGCKRLLSVPVMCILIFVKYIFY